MDNYNNIRNWWCHNGSIFVSTCFTTLITKGYHQSHWTPVSCGNCSNKLSNRKQDTPVPPFVLHRLGCPIAVQTANKPHFYLPLPRGPIELIQSISYHWPWLLHSLNYLSVHPCDADVSREEVKRFSISREWNKSEIFFHIVTWPLDMGMGYCEILKNNIYWLWLVLLPFDLKGSMSATSEKFCAPSTLKMGFR